MTPEPDDSELVLVLKGLFRSEAKAKAFLEANPGITPQDALAKAATEARAANAARMRGNRKQRREGRLNTTGQAHLATPFDGGLLNRDAILYQAHALAISSLPYRSSNDTHLTRTLELMDGTLLVVTFSRGDKNIPIPYGHDRMVLVHLADEAVRNMDPKIVFHNAKEFLEKFDMTDGGPVYREFIQSIKRIGRMKCTIAWIPPGASGEGLINPPEMIRYAYLPSEGDVVREEAGESPLIPYTILFGKEFYEELIKDPLPLSLDAAMDIRKKKSFLAWDLYQVLQFLRRRGPAGQTIYAPWKNIAGMLGAEGEYVRKLKYKIEKQIIKNPDYASAFTGVAFHGDILEIPPDPAALAHLPAPAQGPAAIGTTHQDDSLVLDADLVAPEPSLGKPRSTLTPRAPRRTPRPKPHKP